MKTLPWGFGPRWFRKRRQRRALDAMGDAVRKGLETTAEQYRGSATVRRQPNGAIAHRGELLAEVDRLRALQTPVFVTLPADAVTPDRVDEFNAAWQEVLQSPQKIIVLPPAAAHWNAAEYCIGVDSAGDSHDWVYVQHLPCETDVYSGRDDRELYTADRLVETMMAHRCEGTADQAEPRSHDYPVGG